MCNPSYQPATVHRQLPSKKPQIRLHRLNRRRRFSKEAKEKARVGVVRREMEIKNLKLFMENQSIIKENEKLRKRALLLHQENRVLLSQFEKLAYPHNRIPHNNIKH